MFDCFNKNSEPTQQCLIQKYSLFTQNVPFIIHIRKVFNRKTLETIRLSRYILYTLIFMCISKTDLQF